MKLITEILKADLHVFTRISQQAQLCGKEEALRCSLLHTADLRERRQGGEL